jgi:hypothetical protein
MREKYPMLVERGRILDGPYGTAPFCDCGAFLLQHPTSRQVIKVIAGNGDGWDHVSVSTPTRCPTWEEMCWVKGLFFRDDECVMQLHVPADQHINTHPNCLHLWRPHGADIPRPDASMV